VTPDYLNQKKEFTDQYIMCWFDDTEPDMTKDLRAVTGSCVQRKVTCELNNKTCKRTYNATFNAEHGKI